MPVISIYTSLGEDVELPNEDANILSLLISKVSEIKNDNLLEVFPDIVEKTNHEEKGIDLFVKISDENNNFILIGRYIESSHHFLLLSLLLCFL